ncbi:PAS domain-containing protein [Planococcus beigongshangi]|uniref:PAS domain-containing protein n=1 Tax=Planococcus beigongshangi TaxID=2782536 RepID=UPI00193BD288|nr:PAS domain-containing protein [Planococcus beigongshangi]
MEKNDRQIQEWINTIDEFLIAVDDDGKIIGVNQAWMDFCSEHDVRGSLWKPGSDYFEQLEQHGKISELHSIQKVMTNEIIEHKQMYPFLLGNGETQWLQVRVRGIQYAFGENRVGGSD